MIAFGVRRIFLACAVTDMRKSFDSLACVVQHQLQHDPLSGDAFVFVGRDKKRLKVLLWDRDGYWVLAKRVDVGTFALPCARAEKLASTVQYLDAAAWSLLLAGITIEKMKRSRRIRCIYE
jgi:transposase